MFSNSADVDDQVSQKSKKRHRSEEEGGSRTTGKKKKRKLENSDDCDIRTPQFCIDIDAVNSTPETKRRHKHRSHKPEDSAIDEDCKLMSYENVVSLTKLQNNLSVPDSFNVNRTPQKYESGRRKKHKCQRQHVPVLEKSFDDDFQMLQFCIDVDAVNSTPETKRRHKHKRHKIEVSAVHEDCKLVSFEKAMPLPTLQNIFSVHDSLDVNGTPLKDESGHRKKYKNQRQRRQHEPNEDEFSLVSDVMIVEDIHDSAISKSHRHHKKDRNTRIMLPRSSESDAADVSILEVPEMATPPQVEKERHEKKHRHLNATGDLSRCFSAEATIAPSQENNFSTINDSHHRRKKKRHHQRNDIENPTSELDISIINSPPADISDQRQRRKKRRRRADGEELSDVEFVGVSSQPAALEHALKPDASAAVRFAPPSTFKIFDTATVPSQLYWEDVVTADTELFLIRAPTDFNASDLDGARAVLGQTVILNNLQVDLQSTTIEKSGSSTTTGLVAILPSKQDKKLHLAAEIRGLITVARPLVQHGSRKKKKRKELHPD